MSGQPRNVLSPEAVQVQALDTAALLSAIVSSSSDPIVSKTLDGVVTSWNEAAAQLFGYSEEEMLGQSIRRIIPPDRQQEESHFLARIGAERVQQFETVRLHKDGSPIDVAVTISPVKNASGAIIGASKIVRDISPRKRAEKAAEREARLLDLSGEAIFAWKLHGAIESWNKGAAALYGYNREEAIGRISHDLLATQHPKGMRAIEEELERNGEWRGELTHRAKDNRTLVVETSLQLMRQDQSWLVLETNRDITERKQAEASLRENTDRLAAVLEIQREIAYASLNYTALLQTILEHMSRLLGADGACLEIFDSNELIYEAATGLAAGFVGMRVKREASLSGLSMSTNEILRADDTESDPRVDREACRRIGLRSMILMPLRYDERSFGVLKLMSIQPGAFTADADQTLRLMQEFLGVTIARQRAQAALRANEEQFRTLADAIPQLAWMANADGWLTWYNRRWYEYTGTTPEQMEGWGWQSVQEPETLPAVLERWKASMATGEPFDMILSLRGADGVFRRFLTRGQPLKNAEGRVVRWFGTNTDVDELKRAEEALLESNARLTKVLEVETVGVIFWNLTTGCMTDANDTFLTMMGYSRQDVEAGRLTWQKLTPPEYVEASLAELRKFAANGRVGPYEKEYFRKDGSRQWLIFAGSSLGGKACVEFCVDISARKKAEEALRGSEERYRGVFQNAGTGIAITDLQGRILSCNPAYRRMLGYGEEELLLLDFRSLVHPEDREANVIEIRRLLAQEVAEFEILNRYVGKDGQRIWVHKHVSLIRDDKGRPMNIVALVTDMTKRKEADDQIQLLLREVNHRAKNMLALVQAVARLTIAASPEDFLQLFGERVRALAASQDLLVKHEWKGVDLEELIRFQLSPFEDLIGSRIRFGGTPLFISASAAQALGMAIHELATNASKYGALSAPHGRVDIHWRLADTENGEPAFVMNWSERDGPPVSKPARRGFGSKVFGPLIESSLNGAAELHFAPTGLSWRLTCPARELVDGNAPRPTAKHVPASSPSRTRRRILVVEDEPLVALEVAHVLAEARFDVVGPTRDVAGALSLLNRGGCDAAVLNINLGHETSEPVAIELTRRRTPFVTLSGYSRAQQSSSFDGAPALAKPVKPDLLIATLTRCLADGIRDQVASGC